MRKLIVFSTFLLFVINVKSQTLIATSIHSEATANQNQRKIVRDSTDNVYIVYEDIFNQENVIMGVVFNNISEQWNSSSFIKNGKNPTLSISKDGKIHLIYESNDFFTKIKHISTFDFQTWSPDLIISDTIFKSELPIADVDSAGTLNVFWIQKNDSINESLIYAYLIDEILINRKTITTKNDIRNIAIANHLQYYKNDLIFAIQFNQDSLQFFNSSDNLSNFDTIFKIIGTQPCITFNSISPWDYYPDDFSLRLLYLNQNAQLIEVEFFINFIGFTTKTLQYGNIDYVCIDNIAPPIGFSYLFMKNENLYHGFSYGSNWYWSTILDSTLTNPIFPSIAYKSFNFSFVDYIWMENNDNGYNIFHKRDPKHIWVGLEDKEDGKGFTITGFPNPFINELTINVSVANNSTIPNIQIYNTQSQLIKTIDVKYNRAIDYSCKWNGTNLSGVKVNNGVYIIVCSVGNKKTARKVIFNDN